MANKAELIKRCEELGIDPKPLTTNKLLAAAIKAKEAELAADEEVTDPETVNSKPKTVNVYEDADGRKWGFKSFAPKTLNINGHVMTQQEILETEEVISELVYGNCTFLTQKHN